MVQLTKENHLLKAQLNSAFTHIKKLEGTVTELRGHVTNARREKIAALGKCKRLRDDNGHLKEMISDLEYQKCILSYGDVQLGRHLGNHVKDFTSLCNFKCNDTFLDHIPFSDW